MTTKTMILMTICCLFFYVGNAYCEDKEKIPNHDLSKTNFEDKATTSSTEDLMLAYKLAHYGYRTKSPESLLVSAQILLDTPAQRGELEKKTEREEGALSEKKQFEHDPVSDPVKLLEDARAMAIDNKALLILIEEEKPVVLRAPVGGPTFHTDIVSGHSTDIYEVKLSGEEPTNIGIQGDGDTDLDCFVYDDNGHLIDSVENLSDTCSFGFTPLWPGQFTLRIRNRGKVNNQYILAIE